MSYESKTRLTYPTVMALTISQYKYSTKAYSFVEKLLTSQTRVIHNTVIAESQIYLIVRIFLQF